MLDPLPPPPPPPPGSPPKRRRRTPRSKKHLPSPIKVIAIKKPVLNPQSHGYGGNDEMDVPDTTTFINPLSPKAQNHFNNSKTKSNSISTRNRRKTPTSNRAENQTIAVSALGDNTLNTLNSPTSAISPKQTRSTRPPSRKSQRNRKTPQEIVDGRRRAAEEAYQQCFDFEGIDDNDQEIEPIETNYSRFEDAISMHREMIESPPNVGTTPTAALLCYKNSQHSHLDKYPDSPVSLSLPKKGPFSQRDKKKEKKKNQRKNLQEKKKGKFFKKIMGRGKDRESNRNFQQPQKLKPGQSYKSSANSAEIVVRKTLLKDDKQKPRKDAPPCRKFESEGLLLSIVAPESTARVTEEKFSPASFKKESNSDVENHNNNETEAKSTKEEKFSSAEFEKNTHTTHVSNDGDNFGDDLSDLSISSHSTMKRAINHQTSLLKISDFICDPIQEDTIGPNPKANNSDKNHDASEEGLFDDENNLIRRAKEQCQATENRKKHSLLLFDDENKVVVTPKKEETPVSETKKVKFGELGKDTLLSAKSTLPHTTEFPKFPPSPEASPRRNSYEKSPVSPRYPPPSPENKRCHVPHHSPIREMKKGRLPPSPRSCPPSPENSGEAWSANFSYEFTNSPSSRDEKYQALSHKNPPPSPDSNSYQRPPKSPGPRSGDTKAKSPRFPPSPENARSIASTKFTFAANDNYSENNNSPQASPWRKSYSNLLLQQNNSCELPPKSPRTRETKVLPNKSPRFPPSPESKRGLVSEMFTFAVNDNCPLNNVPRSSPRRESNGMSPATSPRYREPPSPENKKKKVSGLEKVTYATGNKSHSGNGYSRHKTFTEMVSPKSPQRRLYDDHKASYEREMMATTKNDRPEEKSPISKGCSLSASMTSNVSPRSLKRLAVMRRRSLVIYNTISPQNRLSPKKQQILPFTEKNEAAGTKSKIINYKGTNNNSKASSRARRRAAKKSADTKKKSSSELHQLSYQVASRTTERIAKKQRHKKSTKQISSPPGKQQTRLLRKNTTMKSMRVDRDALVAKGLSLKSCNPSKTKRVTTMVQKTVSAKEIMDLELSRKESAYQDLREDNITDPIRLAGVRMLSKTAIPIQSEIRRFLAKKEVLHRMRALKVIQAYFRRWQCEAFKMAYIHYIEKIQAATRGWIAYKKMEKVRGDATMIQAAVRGWQLREVLHYKNQCAKILQNAYRCHTARLTLDILRCASVIQRSFRCYVSKRTLNRLRGEEYILMIRSATIIESCWRMYYNQITYQFDLADITLVQSIVRRWSACRLAHNKSVEKRKILLDEMIEQKMLVYDTIKKERLEACIRIQSCWRRFEMYNAYKVYKASVLIQSFWRRYEIHRSYHEYMGSRTIQKIWRGFKTRTAYRIYRSAIKLQSVYRMFKVRTAYGHYIGSRNIQRVWRGYITRKSIAATKLQSVYRMFKIRTAYGEYIGSRTIQKVWRGFKTRKAYQFFVATVKIQSLWRGYKTYRAFLIYNAAIKLQSAYRMFKIRTAYTMYRSAVKIQHQWHCFKIRSAIKVYNAASAIQASVRRFNTYTNYKKFCAAILIQSHFRRWRCEAFKMAHIYYATSIQSAVRGWLACTKMKKICAATTKIQSVYRGWSLREAAADEKYCGVMIQRAFRCYAARLALKKLQINHELKLHNAATVIQACLRMYHTRIRYENDVADMKHWAAVNIQRVFRGYKGYTDFVFTVDDIMTIQCIARAWLARRKLKVLQRAFAEEVEIQKNFASQKLQAVFRGFRVRKALRIYIAARKIQKIFRGYRCYKRCVLLMKHRAATIIQKNWRQHHTYQTMYKREWGARTIQKSWRGFLCYTDFLFVVTDILIVQKTARRWLAGRQYQILKNEQRDLAACQLQAVYRGFHVRRAFRIYRSACQIQKIFRGYRCYKPFVLSKQHRAATLIQSSWRGFYQYTETLFTVRDILTIQSFARRWIARKEVEVLKEELKSLIRSDCATKIQTNIRGYNARKVATKSISSVTQIQASWRCFRDRSSYNSIVCNIIKLQALTRGLLARSEGDLRLGCAIVLQCIARGYIARKVAYRKKLVQMVETTAASYSMRESRAIKRIVSFRQRQPELRKQKEAALKIERFFIMVKEEVEREICRQQRKKLLKKEARRKEKKRSKKKQRGNETAVALHEQHQRHADQHRPRLQHSQSNKEDGRLKKQQPQPTEYISQASPRRKGIHIQVVSNGVNVNSTRISQQLARSPRSSPRSMRVASSPRGGLPSPSRRHLPSCPSPKSDQYKAHGVNQQSYDYPPNSCQMPSVSQRRNAFEQAHPRSHSHSTATHVQQVMPQSQQHEGQSPYENATARSSNQRPKPHKVYRRTLM